ncbi:MAG: SoxR reducing system RseC family protein [Deltaproteobacteria bacterium]|nr:SoxR reducing system RseC family protein [Deltaproteobacteria bacterium]
MPENIGVVIKTEPNGTAQVLLDRKSACGGCQSAGSGCHSCLTSANKIQSRAINAVGAHVGDVVKVQLSFGSLTTGAVVLYLLPVIGMLCGAFTGLRLAKLLSIAEISGSILGAVSGLVVGFIIVVFVDHSPRMRKKMTPTVTGVVTTGIPMAGIKG